MITRILLGALCLLAGSSASAEVEAASCANPLKVGGNAEPSAPRYFIGLKERGLANVERVAQHLAREYGLVLEDIYPWGGVFVPDIQPAVVALLRCDARLEYIEHNGVTKIGATQLEGPNKPLQPIARENARSG